jgi:RNA polymerase sigma factor for flagellar operon FliA
MSVVWQNASSPGSTEATHTITHEHLGLVHYVARQLARTLHDKVDLDELVSAGTLGLMQAAASYEPSRGLSFSTFAVPRIRGSMLDELRRHDPVSRGVRQKTRAMEGARERLTRRLGREPHAAEVARELDIPEATLRQWQLDVEGSVRLSLDRAPRSLGDRETLTAADAIADDRAVDVEERLTLEQRVTLLGIAIRGLRTQERTVLALYYHEELTLQEIAQVLGLSASRISQIRTEALAKLRAHLPGTLS